MKKTSLYCGDIIKIADGSHTIKTAIVTEPRTNNGRVNTVILKPDFLSGTIYEIRKEQATKIDAVLKVEEKPEKVNCRIVIYEKIIPIAELEEGDVLIIKDGNAYYEKDGSEYYNDGDLNTLADVGGILNDLYRWVMINK